MAKRNPWNETENAAVVSLYFRMLDGEQRTDGRLNKAACIRIAQGQPKGQDRMMTETADFAGKLSNRSRGSIEAKLMNCSAAHRDIDPEAITMDGYGYRALSNYQASLKTAMADALNQRAIENDIDIAASLGELA